MVDKPRSSKSLSEDDFNAQLRSERAQKPASHGMVMTPLPSGPSRSLEEVLRDHPDTSEKVKAGQASEPHASERKYQKIDVSLIDPNPLAPREVYTAEMIRDRAEALRTQGQHDPIHVIPNPDEPGRFIICDGWTRVQSCRDHQVMHELLAEVHEGMSLEAAAWFGYQQNEERELHCDLDRAMFYEKLIANGHSAAEIAKQAGFSRSQMTFFRSFARLPADVLEIVRSSPKKFGASASYQISKVVDRAGVKQAAKLASRYCEEERTFSWLVGQVQSLVEPRHHRQPASSKQVKFGNGVYKQRGHDFEVLMTVKDPVKRAAFASRLEALLATVAEDADGPQGDGDGVSAGGDDADGKANEA
ncbi:hypothetical protein TMEC54S_00217 [Thauera mechernichensis]